MNRYKYILKTIVGSTTSKTIGLFPWGTIIDTKDTSIKNHQLTFLEEGVEFLNQLSANNVSVVLFINQFKPAVPMKDLQDFSEAVEDFVKKQNVNVIGMYWAPGTEKQDPYVVPNPGMFNRVTENTGMQWDNIPVLSISELDLSAASKAKAAPIKIGSASTKWKTYSTLKEWTDTVLSS